MKPALQGGAGPSGSAAAGWFCRLAAASVGNGRPVSRRWFVPIPLGVESPSITIYRSLSIDHYPSITIERDLGPYPRVNRRRAFFAPTLRPHTEVRSRRSRTLGIAKSLCDPRLEVRQSSVLAEGELLTLNRRIARCQPRTIFSPVILVPTAALQAPPGNLHGNL
jgi:hypothetical protein